MPFVAPFIVWLGTLSAFTASLVVGVIMTGLNFAIKAVVGLFGKGSSSPSLANDHANHSVTVRQPTAPRRVVFGRDLIGGVYTFISASGTNNEYLEIVVTFTGHEIDAYEEIWFDDKQVLFDLSGNALGAYSGLAKIEYKLGAAGEAAFPNLMASLPSQWTSNHRQDGCASIHLQLKLDQTAYASGVPNIRAKIRGAKLYDPRSGTTAWGNNSALCARYYLAASYGINASPADIDDTLVSSAANICDELVATSTGTEARYACDGTFDMSEQPGAVLKDLLTSMSGRCVWSGGKWRVYAGAWRAPVLSYNDDDIGQGSIAVSVRRSRRDICNGVKGTFIDPNNQWQPTDFPAYYKGTSRGYSQDDYLLEDAGVAVYRGNWANATVYHLLDGVNVSGSYYVCIGQHLSDPTLQPGTGTAWRLYWQPAERIWLDVEFRFTKSSSTAQRLAKIQLENTRRQLLATIPYKISAYRSVPPDVIQCTHPRFGWTNKTFELTQLGLEVGQSNSAPMLAVKASLAETDANVYAWSSADDIPTTSPAALTLPNTANDGSMGPLVASSGSAGHVVLNWTAPMDSASLGGNTYVDYKIHTFAGWLHWSKLDGDATTDTVGGLASGTVYDFQVSNINIYGVRTAFFTTTATAP